MLINCDFGRAGWPRLSPVVAQYGNKLDKERGESGRCRCREKVGSAAVGVECSAEGGKV